MFNRFPLSLCVLRPMTAVYDKPSDRWLCVDGTRPRGRGDWGILLFLLSGVRPHDIWEQRVLSGDEMWHGKERVRADDEEEKYTVFRLSQIGLFSSFGQL